jgi:hypothetical protein
MLYDTESDVLATWWAPQPQRGLVSCQYMQSSTGCESSGIHSSTQVHALAADADACVCMCLCVCVCQPCVNVCLRVHIYICMYVCVSIFVCVHVRAACVHMCLCACACACVHTYACVCHLFFLCAGLHGGAREACRTFTAADQDIIEFHAWQILKHDPR